MFYVFESLKIVPQLLGSLAANVESICVVGADQLELWACCNNTVVDVT
jgi:hypothetical protein